MFLVVLGVSVLVAAAPPDTGSGPGYGARPAHYGDSELSAMSYVHAVEVGVAIEDAVEVFNFTGEPTTFEVYSADLVVDLAGNRAPAAREVEVTGPGSWVTPAVSSLEIAARSSQLVSFTIQVPVGTPPGPYAASLLVERDVAVGGDGVVNRTRISLPVDLEVLGEIDLGVALEPLRAEQDGHSVRFDLSVINTGNVTFEATGTVAIGDDPQAAAADLSLTPSARITAPGATAALTGLWEEAPWIGRISAHPIVEARVGDRAPHLVTGDPITFWVVPWLHLIAIGSALALLIAGLITTRDRRRQWHADRREERALVHEFRQQRRAERHDVPTN